MATVTPDLDLDLRTRLFIDGRFVDAAGGGRFTTENPATGQPLAEVAEGDAADVDAAVRAARAAVEHGPWSTMAPAERKRVLLAVADAIDANTEELARIESLDAGKPIERLPDDRHPRDGRHDPLARGGHRQAQRRRDADRSRRPGDDRPRAGRRRRCGHPVELPGADGRLEAGPGAGHRQRRRHQAGAATPP